MPGECGKVSVMSVFRGQHAVVMAITKPVPGSGLYLALADLWRCHDQFTDLLRVCLDQISGAAHRDPNEIITRIRECIGWAGAVPLPDPKQFVKDVIPPGDPEYGDPVA